MSQSILAGVIPSHEDIISTDSVRSNGARKDCRPTVKTNGTARNGVPCLPADVGVIESCAGLTVQDGRIVTRDCTADDGVPGENDCIGEDIENIIGSPHDDDLDRQ